MPTLLADILKHSSMVCETCSTSVHYEMTPSGGWLLMTSEGERHRCNSIQHSAAPKISKPRPMTGLRAQMSRQILRKQKPEVVAAKIAAPERKFDLSDHFTDEAYAEHSEREKNAEIANRRFRGSDEMTKRDKEHLKALKRLFPDL